MTWPRFDPRCHYGLIPWDWDWWASRRTAARWVVGALSAWIGCLCSGSRRSRGLVNNRTGHLRAPSAAHSRVPSGLIRKGDEWCAEEAYERRHMRREGSLFFHQLIACLPGIAPLNESRPRVNMPLGCQSIPVTCNTNTQNLLSYKINVLLVPACIALAQSHRSLWRALQPMYDRLRSNDLMA